jgi:hypothetical protein
MVRNILGSVIAAIGAAAAVWSPFRGWYNGRLGRDYGVTDLFSASGITAHGAALFVSLLLPFVVAAAVTLVGIVLRSRLLVTVAGVIVLAFTALWMVREGQAQNGLTVDLNGTGLGLGVARAVGGGLLLILGALVMRGHRGYGRHAKGYSSPVGPDERRGPDRGRGPGETDEPYGPDEPTLPHGGRNEPGAADGPEPPSTQRPDDERE